MSDSELEQLAGMLSKIAYEIHDKDGIDDNLKEMLLDFWRTFSHYEQS